MSQQEKTYRVGVFGHYGNNNLGDEAIIQSTIQNLRERFEHIELVGLSLKPNNTRIRHGIESFPIRFDSSKNFKSNFTDVNESEEEKLTSKTSSFRGKIKNLLPAKIKKSPNLFGLLYFLGNIGPETKFLRKARKKLKNLDGVIICGSNQFVDERGGPWGHPFTLMRWVLLAKLTKTKIFFASVGAGPIDHRLSYWMLNVALTNADYVSYRDKGSKDLMERHLSGIDGPVYPDLAHSLKTIPKSRAITGINESVALNPMPVFASHYWPDHVPEKYNSYLDALTKLVVYMLSRNLSIKIYNNHTSDLPVINDLLGKLNEIPNSAIEDINVIENETVQDLIDTISSSDLIVATRFHSIVLPIHLYKPVLGICYHRKSKELMEDVEFGQYYVDVNEINENVLIEKFDSLYDNRFPLSEKLKTHSNRYEKLMDEQWDRIEKLLRA